MKNNKSLDVLLFFCVSSVGCIRSMELSYDSDNPIIVLKREASNKKFIDDQYEKGHPANVEEQLARLEMGLTRVGNKLGNPSDFSDFPEEVSLIGYVIQGFVFHQDKVEKLEEKVKKQGKQLKRQNKKLERQKREIERLRDRVELGDEIGAVIVQTSKKNKKSGESSKCHTSKKKEKEKEEKARSDG